MIQAIFENDKVTSVSSEAFALYEKSRFGERKKNKIEYSLVEVLYLIEAEKMQVFSNNKILTEEKFLKKTRKLDPRITIKFPVFSDLRNKGYILKTALKFGAEFRVYDKGIKPGQDHAKWILYPVRESEVESWYNFSAKNRVAHATRKNLLVGIVDDEEDCVYYQISWIKP